MIDMMKPKISKDDIDSTADPQEQSHLQWIFK